MFHLCIFLLLSLDSLISGDLVSSWPTLIKTDVEDPNAKVGTHVRKSKHKNIFAKDYTPNWSEEFFVIKKDRNTVPWTYVFSDLSVEKNCSNVL